jgi:hypothetical protein
VSIELLELAADGLGPLRDEVVFVGGATVTLWITDPGAPPVRPTKDVDVVVEVATRSAFHDFEARLRHRGFAEDREGDVICRWRHRGGLILDAMPSEPGILGFENRWQGAAIPHAVDRELPSGSRIRAVSPPYLLATKLEAFKGRGNRDFLGSRDFGDIMRSWTVARSSSTRSRERRRTCATTSPPSSPTCRTTRASPTASSARYGPTQQARLAPRWSSCRAFERS